MHPGPDIIFTASQGFSLGRVAALRAVMGVLLGYTAHALLSALGIAAIVATSPFLFVILKWIGVAYLFYLAGQILYSAFQTKNGIEVKKGVRVSLWRGFFTSFLNPKGLLMYLAILPQFISPEGNTAIQALVLSALFIAGCAVVYSTVGVMASKTHGTKVSEKARRRLETVTGILLVGAAIKLAQEVH